MSKEYVASTTPGKTWSVYVHKPQGRPAYACAVEGTLKNEGSFRSFSFMMFQARTMQVPLKGNNTAKNRMVALTALREMMVEAGAIDPSTPNFY